MHPLPLDIIRADGILHFLLGEARKFAITASYITRGSRQARMHARAIFPANRVSTSRELIAARWSECIPRR